MGAAPSPPEGTRPVGVPAEEDRAPAGAARSRSRSSTHQRSGSSASRGERGWSPAPVQRRPILRPGPQGVPKSKGKAPKGKGKGKKGGRKGGGKSKKGNRNRTHLRTSGGSRVAWGSPLTDASA